MISLPTSFLASMTPWNHSTLLWTKPLRGKRASGMLMNESYYQLSWGFILVNCSPQKVNSAPVATNDICPSRNEGEQPLISCHAFCSVQTEREPSACGRFAAVRGAFSSHRGCDHWTPRMRPVTAWPHKPDRHVRESFLSLSPLNRLWLHWNSSSHLTPPWWHEQDFTWNCTFISFSFNT